MAPTIYNCDHCSEAITPHQPRIHCQTCEEYDLCANCALSEQFSGTHSRQHPVTIFKRSGGGGERAVVAESISLVYSPGFTADDNEEDNTVLLSPVSATARSLPSPPPLPRRRSAIETTRSSTSPEVQSPTHSSQPPPLPPRISRHSSSVPSPNAIPSLPPRDIPARPSPSPSPQHANTLPSPPPSASEARPPPRREATLPPTFDEAATCWGPFYNEDMTPTSIFSELLDAIFSYLDVENTGHLSPEAYSKFLNDLGYVGHENTWKNACKPEQTLGIPQEYMADKALKNAYDLFVIDHVIQQRPEKATTPCVSSLTTQCRAFGFEYSPSTTASAFVGSNGAMPLLTRKGFMEITTVEVLCEPARHWLMFNRTLKDYMYAPNAGPLALYKDWGELPRNVLPEGPDPRMKERVRQVSQMAQNKAQEELNAARVRTSFMAQGRQSALDLIDDSRYQYRYAYY